MSGAGLRAAVQGAIWRMMTPDEVSAYNAPRCGARRPNTAAVCEEYAHACMFEREHIGRDRAGRWHAWPHPMVTGTAGARMRALVAGAIGPPR